MSATGGYDGISLHGRWECGNCGASGEGWWDEDAGLTMDAGEHECEEAR